MVTAEQQGVDGASVQVVVDGERCIGAGQCELLEPEVFRIDDDTAVAVVLDGARIAADRAEEVVERCPSGAVTVAPGWTGR